MRTLLAILLIVAGIGTATAQDWPQSAFTCKAYRADLYWQDWARKHCRGWRYSWYRHRHYHHYVAPKPDPEIMRAQIRLQQLGYEIEADGFTGPETRQALQWFQHKNDLPATGELDGATKFALHESDGRNNSKDDETGNAEQLQCKSDTVHVWSGQHSTEANSKGDAQKRWMIGVQARYGSVWMNFANAAAKKWRCFQSQSHDTFLGKAQATGSKIIGGEGYFVVCELYASPCAEPIVDGDQ